MNPVQLRTIFYLFSAGVHAAIINDPSIVTDPNGAGTGTSRYRTWPEPTIRYKINPAGYSPLELAAIRSAMDQIEVDSGNCIKFTAVADNYLAGPWLNIRGRGDPAVPEKACRGSPGFQPNARQNPDGQLLVVYGSLNDNSGSNIVGACLDDQRDIMRLLLNSIGLLNEWKHSKREPFFVFEPFRNSLVHPDYREFMPFDVSRRYLGSDVIDTTDRNFFDAQSITMVNKARYALSAHSLAPFEFKLSKLLPNVPAEARMSVSDCAAVQFSMFNGQCLDPANVKTCDSIDPYPRSPDAAPAVGFTPTNKVIRSVQCQVTSLPEPIVLGELLVYGLPVVSPVTATTLTMKNKPLLDTWGVNAVLSTRKGKVVTPGAVPDTACTAADIAAGNCQYTVRFDLTKVPDVEANGGFKNLNAILLINRGGKVIQRLTATLTVNCAPIFISLTANVGPNALFTSERVYAYGIQMVDSTPPAAGKMITENIRANSAGQLAQYVVNYNIPMGVGEKNPAAPADSQMGVANKVFVNCNTMSTTTVNANAAGNQRLAGTTVIGVVEAVDAEGDDLSYYAFSTDPRISGAAGGPMTTTGELYTVTKDGVITVSGFVDPVEGVAVTGDSSPNPAVGVGGGSNNPNAGLQSGAPEIKPDIARNVFIVAVDKRKGKSVLQARFYFACGEPVTAGLT